LYSTLGENSLAKYSSSQNQKIASQNRFFVVFDAVAVTGNIYA
jgi:hypothetical protein